jgi:oxygen-independent coproporphyrinogen-3 oxidase
MGLAVRPLRRKLTAGAPIQDEFSVAPADLPFEFMMNALRLNQGFDAPLFAARTALPLSVIEDRLRKAEVDGLIIRRPGHIAPSELGRRHLNRLLASFLAD